MIYEMNELQKTLWGSVLPWAQATATLLAPFHHAHCFTHSRQIAAGCELLVRLCRSYPKPEFGLTDTIIDGERVAATESAVVHKSICLFLRFLRAPPPTQP